MAQITAVQWFASEHHTLLIQLENKEFTTGEYAVKHYDILQEAKQMEKEQIMDAYDNVALDDNGNFMTGEQYYNDTYTQSGTEQD